MSRANDHGLTPEQFCQYQSVGITFPVRVMSSVEARRFRTDFEKLEFMMRRPLEYAAMTHLYFHWAYDLATWPKIVDAVEQILGPDVLVQGTLILCKHANDPSFVKWHQDFHYTNWNNSPAVSAWVALSDSTSQSGCLRVIPGSHNRGVLSHTDAKIEHNMLTYSVEIEGTAAIAVELQAGEMSLHQPDMIHGSAPNQSEDMRLGFIIRFVTPKFRQNQNPVIRARGSESCRHLAEVKRPSGNNLESSVAAWREFAEGRNLLK